MKRSILALLSLGAAALVCLSLGTGGAGASPEPGRVIFESGEGIAPGIPARLLRRNLARLAHSAAGRLYLATARGRRYAARVRGYAADNGGQQGEMWCWDHECDPSQEYDFNVADSWSWNDGGGADGNGYFGGCKAPWVRKVYRNKFGIDLWTYNQQVTWCWHAGRITHFHRERWVGRDGHFLNGWSFQGHINSNCALENCNGRGSNTNWTSAWTQGKWQMCVVRWGWCTDAYPLIGIAVNGWGGWGGFFDQPIG